MKTAMKTLLTAMITFAFVQAAKAEFKLAYVDVPKVIQSSKAGKKAKDDMQKEAEKRSKELEKKKADIEKMREDIEKKKSVLSEEAFGKKQMELQEEMNKFNQQAQKAQADLQKKESDLVAPIVEKIKKTIEKVAKEKSISMVIQSNQGAQIVLYATPESDLTDVVVKAFDAEK